MKKLFKGLVLFVICYSSTANAIVNIENMRVKSDDKTEGVETKLSFDVGGKNGNTRKFSAGIGGRIQWYELKQTRFVLLNYEYGESSTVKDTDKTFLHFRNIWYQDKKLAWEAFAQLEENEFTRLNSRMLLGVGARFRVIHEDNQRLDLGLGLFRSKEQLDFSVATSDSGVTYNNRVNLYMVYKYTITNHSRLTNTLYYQPDINDVADYRLFEQFGLQLDVSENLSFNLSLDVVRDSRPPQSIKATDTTYNTGFEYSF